MSNILANAYPLLGSRLATIPLAELPTPVSAHDIAIGTRNYPLLLKHDDLTGTAYGGNKVRKLEYVLQRARERGAARVATFGTVGSNHAVATAVYAPLAGLECTCLLSHQAPKPGLGDVLRFHQQNNTEVVRFGGNRHERVQTMRRYVQGRKTWVVPLGGSSWLGSVGFVNAGLELAAQIDAGEVPCPRRVYIAMGTMGTAAGLALGFALAGLNIETHAVRVTEECYANESALQRLMQKIVALMRWHDPAIPRDLASRSRIVCRHGFFGDGYGRSNAATEDAITLAGNALDLGLESTYTGKTMAALVHDLQLEDLRNDQAQPFMFWNTYNSRPVPVDRHLRPDFERIPVEFERYFD